jgi:hypothetical protein
VSLLRKTHLKQTQSQPHRPLSNHGLDDNDDLIIDDEITYGRNRRSEDFGKIVHEDDEPLSDLKPNKLKMVNENKSNARKQYMDALRELQQTENISYKEAQERYRQEKGKKL